MKFPENIKNKLNQRKENNTFRKLGKQTNLVDFSSNDYLGFAKSEIIFDKTHQFLIDNHIKLNGATGSRLLSGNHILYGEVERLLYKFHNSEDALIFNSGYDANIGFFSSVPQRGDIILYDEFIHASIRDGVKLSNAKAYKFKHNDLENLEETLSRFTQNNIDKNKLSPEIRNLKREIYVVIESVFSMDGDTPDLASASKICKNHNAHFIVDEAHSVGVLGENGCGEIKRLGLENNVFARIVTFGKALGCHGAAILGSKELKEYLINFSRSFIYTTGLSPHSLATIKTAYNQLNTRLSKEGNYSKLNTNIQYFVSEVKRLQLQNKFINSNSAIHCCVISGNSKVKEIAKKLHENGFDVKPILSPTILKEKERLRFCLHSYNSKEEITKVIELLADFVLE